jgi:hypothetical protein
MKQYLKPVEIKLKRASKQLEEINTKLETWIADNKFNAVIEMLPEHKGFSINTGDYSTEGFLDDISLIIGETIHNLRSALDNLAYSIACQKLDPPKSPHKIYFPIFNNKEEFIKRTKDVFNEMPEKAVEIITLYQPFSSAENIARLGKAEHPFSILQLLSNSDKHRTPKILLAIPEEISYEGKIELLDANDDSNLIVSPILINEFLSPNSKIYEIQTNAAVKEINLKITWTIQIAIEIPGSHMNIKFLENIRLTIENLMNVFKKAYPQLS